MPRGHFVDLQDGVSVEELSKGGRVEHAAALVKTPLAGGAGFPTQNE